MHFYEPSTACVIGLGYIGLPTAALMASRGWSVIGVDINQHIVQTVGAGRAHIAEPDLDGLLQKVVADGRLKTSIEPMCADVFIITVPTPITESMAPDTSFVDSAVAGVAPYLRAGNLVIIESTCPVGTTASITERLAQLRCDLSFPTRVGSAADVKVAYCPERVLPGRILNELHRNDRSIGGISDECANLAVAFYKTFVRGECIATTAHTAELVKLTENAFRDVNIAFANEISMVCERLGVDAWELIELANRHPRVNILQPGPGVGGHCIAVDPWFIVNSVPDVARLIATARQVNDAKLEHVYERARAALKHENGKSLVCLGITFKADVDDLRESPALKITERLAHEFGDRIMVVEPNVRELPDPLKSLGVHHVSFRDARRSCGIFLLLVDHEEFRRVPISELQGKVVIDTRGIWRDDRRKPPS